MEQALQWSWLSFTQQQPLCSSSCLDIQLVSQDSSLSCCMHFPTSVLKVRNHGALIHHLPEPQGIMPQGDERWQCCFPRREVWYIRLLQRHMERGWVGMGMVGHVWVHWDVGWGKAWATCLCHLLDIETDRVSGWALMWAHSWGRAGDWWAAGQRKLLMKGYAVLSWFSLAKLWVCQSETWFLQIHTACALLPFKSNILCFRPGRKTPRRAPIVAVLFVDRLVAVTPTEVLQ